RFRSRPTSGRSFSTTTQPVCLASSRANRNERPSMSDAALADPLLKRAPNVRVPEETGYALFDADSHYYEAVDCLTRHLPKAYASRGAKWAEIKGKKRLMLGDKLYGLIPNATIDPLAKPGCLHDYVACNLEREGSSVIDLIGAL